MQVWCEFCQNACVFLTPEPWICRHSKKHVVGFTGWDPKIDNSHKNQNYFFTISSILFLYMWYYRKF